MESVGTGDLARPAERTGAEYLGNCQRSQQRRIRFTTAP